MFFVVMLILTVVFALLHIMLGGKRMQSPENSIELFLVYFLFFYYGVGGMIVGVQHIVRPEIPARYFGWAPSFPFQSELGFATIGLALTGLLSAAIRGTYLIAPAAGNALFAFGTAYLRIADLISAGRTSVYYTWPVILTDILVPLVVLILLVSYRRSRNRRERLSFL